MENVSEGVREIPLQLHPPLNDGKKKEEPKDIEAFFLPRWYFVRVLIFCQFLLLVSAGNVTFMMFAGSAAHTVPCRDNNKNVSDLCLLPEEHRKCFDIQPNYEFKSVNVEFGYFCESSVWVKCAISVDMLGILLGVICSPGFSDRHGPKKMIKVSLIGSTILSFLVPLSTNLLTFTALRTLLGVFSGSLLCVQHTFKLENIPTRFTFVITTVIALAPTVLLLNSIANLANSWITYQSALGLFSLPIFFLLHSIYESPKWLIRKGDFDEAERIFEEIQEVDNIPLSMRDNVKEMIAEEKKKYKKQKESTVKDILNDHNAVTTVSILAAGAIINGMISHCILFNLDQLTGSLFVNSIFFTLIHWFSSLLPGLLQLRYKFVTKKKIHSYSQLVIVASLTAIASIYMMGKKDDWAQLVRVAALVTGGIAAQLDLCKGTAASEIFNSRIRDTVIYVTSVASKIGNVFGPIALLVIPWQWMSFSIFGALSLLDGLLFFFLLPEPTRQPRQEQPPHAKVASKISPAEKSIV